MQTYLVGGAVRDALMGLPVQDRDWVVVGATPQALLDQDAVVVVQPHQISHRSQSHQIE